MISVVSVSKIIKTFDDTKITDEIKTIEEINIIEE